MIGFKIAIERYITHCNLKTLNLVTNHNNRKVSVFPVAQAFTGGIIQISTQHTLWLTEM